ncbi:MAG: ATP-binding protein [Oscillospiraceae bacterium]
MIKLIVGNKGSGKTKALIDLANKAASTSKGNVVCVEKGLKLTYDLDHKARLVDSDHYSIDGFDSLYGFIAGLLAGDYDITDLFIDSTFKIGGNDINKFEEIVKKLADFTKENNVNLVFLISCDANALPEGLKQYSINY